MTCPLKCQHQHVRLRQMSFKMSHSPSITYNKSVFIFLNKTTNSGSENNLVYPNARELIVQNRKKRYNTSQKGL
jgi:hypothetical protein